MDELTLREADRLELLDLDTAELRKLISVVRDIEQRLKETRRTLAELRPGNGKNFDQELARLAGVLSALEGQLSAADHDVEAEILALKRKAAEDTPALAVMNEQVKDMDREIIDHLRRVYDLAHERHTLALEMDRLGGILSTWQTETRKLDEGSHSYPNGAFPGAAAWRFDHPREAFLTYARRYYALVGSGLPLDGEDALAWYSRKRI